MPIKKCLKCNSGCLVKENEPAPDSCNNCNEKIQNLFNQAMDENITEEDEMFFER